jgi:hypothetical protein
MGRVDTPIAPDSGTLIVKNPLSKRVDICKVVGKGAKEELSLTEMGMVKEVVV